MEDKIQNLLQEADRMAGQPKPVPAHLSALVRRRAEHRHTVHIFIPYATAALVVLTAGVLTLTFRNIKQTQDQKKIAVLEDQIKQLQTKTDAALNLLQNAIEEERKQNQLTELETELASIPDPLEEIQKQVDKTAFILLYQADRMYRELNQTSRAVETYNRIIELFPKNRWAQVAQQRLLEIENRKFNKAEPKGEFKWNPQKESLSC
jgi:tetratricopeptide (TPR) repeat protein